VAPSSVLSVYCDKICLKFASHDFLLYAVIICQNHEILSTHSNATRYQQIAINVGQSWPHFSWPTLYIHFSVKCQCHRVYSRLVCGVMSTVSVYMCTYRLQPYADTARICIGNNVSRLIFSRLLTAESSNRH